MTEDDRTRREAHGLSVEIDRDLCVGFGDCVDASPEAFELDAEDVAVFASPEDATREELLRACRSCPVDALTARDADGNVLAP